MTDQARPPTFTPYVSTSVPPTEPLIDGLPYCSNLPWTTPTEVTAEMHAVAAGVATRHWSYGDALAYHAQHCRTIETETARADAAEADLARMTVRFEAASNVLDAELEHNDALGVQCSALRAENAAQARALAAMQLSEVTAEQLSEATAERDRARADLANATAHPGHAVQVFAREALAVLPSRPQVGHTRASDTLLDLLRSMSLQLSEATAERDRARAAWERDGQALAASTDALMQAHSELSRARSLPADWLAGDLALVRGLVWGVVEVGITQAAVQLHTGATTWEYLPSLRRPPLAVGQWVRSTVDGQSGGRVVRLCGETTVVLTAAGHRDRPTARLIPVAPPAGGAS